MNLSYSFIITLAPPTLLFNINVISLYTWKLSKVALTKNKLANYYPGFRRFQVALQFSYRSWILIERLSYTPNH